MGDMNYIGGVARILETPKQKFLNKNISVTQFRVQFPTARHSSLINLIFWGKLANDVKGFYNINDYIIIEGYLSVRKKKISGLTNKIQKKVEITVLKIYPFVLTYNS